MVADHPGVDMEASSRQKQNSFENQPIFVVQQEAIQTENG